MTQRGGDHRIRRDLQADQQQYLREALNHLPSHPARSTEDLLPLGWAPGNSDQSADLKSEINNSGIASTPPSTNVMNNNGKG